MSKRKADARRMRFFRTCRICAEKTKDEFEEALERVIDESVEDAIREVEPSVGSFDKVW